MAHTKCICPAGEVFHVLNRAVARLTIFEKTEDLAAFMRAVEETWGIVPLPISAIVAMSNHLHVVARTRPDLVKTWSDEEVSLRWWNLFPQRRKQGSLA